MSDSLQCRQARGKTGFFGRMWRILLLGISNSDVGLVLLVYVRRSPLVGRGCIIPGSRRRYNRNRHFMDLHPVFFWVGGSIFLGLFCLLTTPAKTPVPIERKSD